MRRDWRYGGYDTGQLGVRGAWICNAEATWTVGVFIATDWRQCGIRAASARGSAILSVGGPLEHPSYGWRPDGSWRMAGACFSLRVRFYDNLMAKP